MPPTYVLGVDTMEQVTPYLLDLVSDSLVHWGQLIPNQNNSDHFPQNKSPRVTIDRKIWDCVHNRKPMCIDSKCVILQLQLYSKMWDKGKSYLHLIMRLKLELLLYWVICPASSAKTIITRINTLQTNNEERHMIQRPNAHEIHSSLLIFFY